MREKEIKVTPLIGIKSLKQPKELAKFVPEHDIIKLSFEENDDFVNNRNEVIFEILYQTGVYLSSTPGYNRYIVCCFVKYYEIYPSA